MTNRPAPRIAYIINSVEGGGAALPVPAVAEVVRECGAQVRVFALTRRDGRALPPMEAAGLDPLVREGGEMDHLSALRWLVHEARAWGATHLWTSLSRATILGLVAGPAMGLPVISWQHAAFLKPWNRRLMRMLQSRAALWVADSQCVAELTRSRLGVGPERLMEWPIFSADPDRPAARPWRPGEPLRIGSLGRLHPVKGYDVLIDALAILQTNGFSSPVPVRYSIAGEGDERDRLEARLAEAALDIDLMGYVEEPERYLASLHLYLQPSRSEGFCIAIHEALTAGLPVIASSVGEPAFTVMPQETGWLFPPGDVEALAGCLRQVLSDPDTLATMGEAARRDALERFSPARFAEAGGAICDRIFPWLAPARSRALPVIDRSSSRLRA
jgi:hypothetical protein